MVALSRFCQNIIWMMMQFPNGPLHRRCMKKNKSLGGRGLIFVWQKSTAKQPSTPSSKCYLVFECNGDEAKKHYNLTGRWDRASTQLCRALDRQSTECQSIFPKKSEAEISWWQGSSRLWYTPDESKGNLRRRKYQTLTLIFTSVFAVNPLFHSTKIKHMCPGKSGRTRK